MSTNPSSLLLHSNKYYENTEEDFGRERWVEFGNEKLFEASQIPPEWHMWMHAMNDSHPGNTKYVKKHWETEYQENLTGSKKNYVPYRYWNCVQAFLLMRSGFVAQPFPRLPHGHPRSPSADR